MKCNSIVMVKQVPDTSNISGDVMRPDGTVNRAKLPTVFNPDDKVALELALDLRDRFGGKVTAITMGPAKAGELLRECLYMGADEVHLITDRNFGGADTLATSYTLSEAIKQLGPYDLIFAGRQAIDGDTAQVGPQTAEKLRIPQITYAEKILDLKEDGILVKRRIDDGYEILESSLPLLITVLKEAATPRPFKARRLMALKRARTRLELEKEAASPGELEKLIADYASKGLYIRTWSREDLGIELERCGIEGSPTKVHKIESVVLSSEGHQQVPPTSEGIGNLLDSLIEEHFF
ncbi:MAG: electron transfer flavoprotein subunit beta/FixA family protein, partial [Deltaproteobacteria bacterium]|nr:electron transfer flavoprotein subunit beta/FixA family protein [Deltaproteobacteria bacterium]